MSEWTTSRKDMDSFTVNGNGETAHVVYMYPPDDEPRIAVFGTNPRKRAEDIVRAVNTFDQAREALKGISSEVAMMLGLQEEELRDLFGHANVGCLKERLGQAKAALDAMEG